MIQPREFIGKIKPYKPGKPIEEVIRELGLTGEVIKLASNENPLGTSPLALAAMRSAVEESALYPDDNCYYLKNALARRHGVDAPEIIVGNGSVEILPLITLAYLHPQDNAVVSQGAFIWYKIAVGIAGAELIEAPMRDHAHDLTAMRSAIRKNTKLVFIANPNNPTGTMVTRDAVNDFFRQVPDDILVVIDEAYCDYIADPRYPNSLEIFRERKNIVILRTFSKIYGLAGTRLGYGIARREIVADLMKLRVSFNVNRIAQAAGIAALEDEAFVKESIAVNEEGKTFLSDAYKDLGLFFLPTFGNFFFVDFGKDSLPIFEALQKRGIIARPIREYGFPNALRITIGTEGENRRLIAALKEIL